MNITTPTFKPPRASIPDLSRRFGTTDAAVRAAVQAAKLDAIPVGPTGGSMVQYFEVDAVKRALAAGARQARAASIERKRAAVYGISRR